MSQSYHVNKAVADQTQRVPNKEITNEPNLHKIEKGVHGIWSEREVHLNTTPSTGQVKEQLGLLAFWNVVAPNLSRRPVAQMYVYWFAHRFCHLKPEPPIDLPPNPPAAAVPTIQ
jgi:hypothetical protein